MDQPGGSSGDELVTIDKKLPAPSLNNAMILNRTINRTPNDKNQVTEQRMSNMETFLGGMYKFYNVIYR
jgi:hypothetical protein